MGNNQTDWPFNSFAPLGRHTANFFSADPGLLLLLTSPVFTWERVVGLRDLCQPLIVLLVSLCTILFSADPNCSSPFSEPDRNANMTLSTTDSPGTNGRYDATGGSQWTPSSWRSKPIKQCPEYPDPKAVERATSELARMPPIVHPHEINKLKEHLKDVAEGRAFLLQGGDCAELFDYCRQDIIESKIKLLLQMSLVLIRGTNKKVVRIGRMAGQYAKPRSSPFETVNGQQIPSFRGDILNGFDLNERELDPQRLVKSVPAHTHRLQEV
jgi:hypothetical protein